MAKGRNTMPEGQRFEQHCISGMPCQIEVTPIIPVRFSLTKQAIENTAESIIPELPKALDDKNYQLRRLRQGYFYLFTELGMTTHSSDGKQNQGGKWLVFEYVMNSTGDSNGNLLSNIGNNGGTVSGVMNAALTYFNNKKNALLNKPYQFRKYTWKDGSARNEWVADTMSYPYAFVNKSVSLIQYAYSEVRWPAELFELLENDAALRKTLMQSASLKPENSPNSFPFSQLGEKVVDFNPHSDALQELADSYTRRTALGYFSQHTITINDKGARERARVVVVHDHIGNIADISCYHEYMWANLIQAQKQYDYATTTAKAVTYLEPHLRKKRLFDGLFGEQYPIDASNRAELEKYADPYFFTKKFESEIKQLTNIAKVHSALIKQDGHYSVNSQLQAVLQLLNTPHQPERLALTNAYAAYLLIACIQLLSVSTQGMQALAKQLTTDELIGTYLQTVLTTSAKVISAYGQLTEKRALKLLEIETLVETVSAAQLYRWSHSHLFSNSITQETFLSAFGMTRQYIKMNGNADIYSQHLERQVRLFTQNRISISKMSTFSPNLQQTTLSGTAFRQQAQAVIIVPDGQSGIQNLQEQVNFTNKVGVFFAFVALFDTLESFKAEPDNPLLDPLLLTATNLTGFIASLEYDADGIVKQGVENVKKAVGSSLSRTFGSNNLLVQAFNQTTDLGRGKINRALQIIGHCANVLTILVAIGEGIKANKTGDKTALLSASEAGFAEVAFIIAKYGWLGSAARTPLIILGVVLVLASVITFFLTDNVYESWVRKGFWGNSREYWNGHRIKQYPYLKRLNLTYILADPNNPNYADVQKKLNDEMNDFYNLIWNITIKNDVKGDNKLCVYCPAFDGEAAVQKLTVQWEQITTILLPGERQQQYNALNAAAIKKQWLGNCIELDFSAATKLDKDIKLNFFKEGTPTWVQGKLTVTYPHLGDNAENYFKAIAIFAVNEV
ncbi:hypothetical protein EDC44_1022 [Cricetibacter osteomyelitidis]|uniref:Toxin VasX N-terminal region domain-containing protein n=1 Tax=Cricetibacter osteomyelitidis TaxID=1521931 RepID=A0A4R2T2Q9_9PAST|nr:toxin VasX [Cricetibacter osteomyelitidis]TCP97199.1 hypothetical protein EDC44_1022 [Cricetibacter osteomyelitidis]